MKSFIKQFFLILITAFCIFGQITYGFAQTASILPQGVTQYFDNNGNPLSGGKVYNYIPGTLTFKQTWQDTEETILNTNPVTLDAAGRAKILGQGPYRQIVRNANNSLIWDAVTSSTGSGGSAQTGDGDLVGTVKPWAGLVAPNQYAFAYGQEISRTTYSVLLTAITQTLAVTCVSGSPTLTNISDTTQIPINAVVELNCVPPGTLVLSKTATTITLNNNSTLTITPASATFFPYGNGNGSTTFNLPDLRGYVIAGRNNMGGTASSRLTSTYFGSNPDAQAGKGGSQSHTLLVAELATHTHANTLTDPGHSHTKTDPGHNHTVTDAGHVHLLNGGTGLTAAASSATAGSNPVGSTGANTTQTDSGTTGIVINSATTGITYASAFTGMSINNIDTGSSTPFSIVQPTITLNFIIKITPDTNSAVATGVTDIQGMTGSIGCGTGLTCTSNVISVSSTIDDNPIFRPEEYGATNAVNVTDTVTSTAGSPNITTASGHFSIDDVGKFIAIDGIGTGIKTARPVAVGAGYTNGAQILTVSGGTCSVAPTITAYIVANAVSESTALTPGTCSVQPSNPVSVTGGGGAGATFNLTWAALATSISSFTSSTQITLTANVPVTQASSRTIIYGSDATSAINQAATAAAAAAALSGAATVGFCGGYIVNTSSSAAVSIFGTNGIAIIGFCPGSIIYVVGNGDTRGIDIGGSGSLTTTTFASNASAGANTIAATSAAGFSAGDYVVLINNTGVVSDARAMSNRITAINATTFTLQLPLAFNVDTAQTNSITKFSPASRINIQNLRFDCTGATGIVIGLVAENLVDPVITGVSSKSCGSNSSTGFSVYQSFGGWIQITDEGSGFGATSNAAQFSYVSNATINYSGFAANGFGVGLNGIAFNELHIRQNKSMGRVSKLFGSCNNWGSIEASGSLVGWNANAIEGGSCYNTLSLVGENADQCVWSNGTGNINNTYTNIRVANCTTAITIGATDTGNKIVNVDRGPNAASDAIGTTDTAIQAQFETGSLKVSSIVFADFNSSYNRLLDRAGNARMLFADPASDPIYYWNSATYNWKSLNGLTTFAQLDSTALALNVPEIITAQNANAFTVGRQGTTDPALKINNSTASSATGISITSLAAGSGVGVAAISSGTNEGLTINAKGSGGIFIGGTSTGAVTIGTAPNPGLLNIAGSTSGFVGLRVPAVAGSNSITLPAGTTDFSATGGAGQFVKQNSAGGAFTVSTVAGTELSGTTLASGIVTSSLTSVGTLTSLTINASSGIALSVTNSASTSPGFKVVANGTGVLSEAMLLQHADQTSACAVNSNADGYFRMGTTGATRLGMIACDIGGDKRVNIDVANSFDLALSYSGTEALRLKTGSQVAVIQSTASTSTTTGSLVNAGGFGNAGAIYGGTFISIGTKIRAAGAAPALTSCGSSPAISGSDLAGEITMGTGAPTGCTITFNAAYSAAPYCTVTSQSDPNTIAPVYSVSTTAITYTQAATSSNKINYICIGRSGG